MRFHREFVFNPMILLIMAIFVVNSVLVIITYQGWRSWAGLLAGALIYAVMEYLVHRFLMHRFPSIAPMIYKGHAEHHRHPNDVKYLFSAVPYDIAAYTVFYLILLAVTRDWPLTFAIVAGTSLYQLYYQWMHYAAHRPIKLITPWGRWMKKKHLLHHFLDDKSWYGVSHPMLDILLGTDKAQPKKRQNPPPHHTA